MNKSDQATVKDVKEAWNNFICYPRLKNGLAVGSKAFFQSVKEARYGSHPYLKTLVESFNVKGRRVLEVGVGVGTDGVMMSQRGAKFTGMDLTENALLFSKRNFAHSNFEGSFVNANAEILPFRDESFDIVYSCGVLHHTPETKKAIDGIHRVLAKNGEAAVMLYHKNFCTYVLKLILFRGILKGMFFKKDTQGVMNDLEFKDCPLTKLYTKKQARQLFSKYSKVDITTHYFYKYSVPVVGKFLPQRFLDLFQSWWGFHLVIRASK